MTAIVFGYVKRPEAEVALDHAIDEARRRGAHLVVLHSSKGGPSEDVQEVIEYREALEAIEQRLDEEGLDHTLREFVRGRTVAEDVLDTAEEYEAELIVIGLRPRSPVGKLILGSNAQSILLGSSCPVLAVPDPTT